VFGLWIRVAVLSSYGRLCAHGFGCAACFACDRASAAGSGAGYGFLCLKLESDLVLTNVVVRDAKNWGAGAGVEAERLYHS